MKHAIRRVIARWCGVDAEFYALRVALMNEWIAAHAVYCDCFDTQRLRGGQCKWPIPGPLMSLSEKEHSELINAMNKGEA